MNIIPIQTAVPIPYEQIAAFCRRNHIERMWLFGSVLGTKFRSDSDVDMLVEFDPDHIPAWEYFTMPDELAEIIGHPVDLHTPDSLSKYIKKQIVQSAQVIYERA